MMYGKMVPNASQAHPSVSCFSLAEGSLALLDPGLAERLQVVDLLLTVGQHKPTDGPMGMFGIFLEYCWKQ